MLLRRWGRWRGGSYAAAYKDDTSGTFLASYSFHSILITLHLQNEYTQGPYIRRRLWSNNEGACKKPTKKSPRNSIHRGGGVRNDSRLFFLPYQLCEARQAVNGIALHCQMAQHRSTLTLKKVISSFVPDNVILMNEVRTLVPWKVVVS